MAPTINSQSVWQLVRRNSTKQRPLDALNNAGDERSPKEGVDNGQPLIE